MLSPIAAGLWRLHEWPLDTPARVGWVEQALDLGITTFDHADIYGGYTVEALFGQALAAAPQLRRRLQTDAKVHLSAKNAGELRIPFYSADDLERLLDLVLGASRESL